MPSRPNPDDILQELSMVNHKVCMESYDPKYPNPY